MKRTIVVLILAVIIGSMLTAAATRPTGTLSGTLQWERANTCNVSDFVALPVMQNVYLTGAFAPTQGLMQGCAIHAIGSPYMQADCAYFAVDKYTITCNHRLGGHR